MKSRTLAAGLVEDGHVRVDGQRVTTPAHGVRPGEVVTVSLERAVRVLEVLATGERRGPAPEAKLLYREIHQGG